ncbi:MAG TPA: ATP-binding protein [Vicinamibacteria bacterium]|nr:ATP-binding protein [Vicinamibacteria bacterium]
MHVALAALAFAWLRGRGLWLLAGEAGLVASMLLGVHLLRALFGPLQLVRDGVQFIAERDFSSRLREVGQPEVDALVGVYNRMIDSLREERLRAREQHHFLEEVVRASPAGILTFDFDGRLSTVNPGAERLLMRPGSDLLGLRLEDLPVPFVAQVADLAAGESAVLPLQGSRRVRWLKTRFLDHGFPRMLIVVEELTEELRRSERAAYEKVIRTLSHEVGNSIGAAASLLESSLHYREQIRPADRDDFAAALSVANTRLRHLDAFVREYADVVRLPPPHRTPRDLGRLVQGVARLFRPECEERGIALTVDAGQVREPVSLDEHQIEQVLVNVLRNAVEAVARDGTVTVATGTSAGRPFLVVENSGPGIPADVQAALFTPFFSTKANGRGIGLTLAQEILAQHGFGFSLESPAGGPTRFAIRF